VGGDVRGRKRKKKPSVPAVLKLRGKKKEVVKVKGVKRGCWKIKKKEHPLNGGSHLMCEEMVVKWKVDGVRGGGEVGKKRGKKCEKVVVVNLGPFIFNREICRPRRGKKKGV